MATMISVADAELLARGLAILTARVERHAAMIDELIGRLEVLEAGRAATRAEGGA